MDEKPKRPPRKKPAGKRPARKAAPGKPKPAADAQAQPADPQAADAQAADTQPQPTDAPPTPDVAAAEQPTAELTPVEEPTLVAPPADEPTLVAPPPEQTTVVLPPAPLAEGYAPLSRSAVTAPPRDRGPLRWVLVGLAVAAIVAVVLIVAVARGSDADAFAGTWARAAAVGGGLVVEKDGDGVTVTWYDERLVPQGPLSATVDGEVLSFQLPDVDGSGVRDVLLATTDDADVLELTLSGMSEQVIRAEQLQAGLSPSPTPAFTPSTSPTASPSLSPSPSPSLSPSPTPSTSLSGSPSPSPTGTDQGVVNAILSLQAGILTWAGGHGNVYPTAADVTKDGAVGKAMPAWPNNPYTGQPMVVGSSVGDYAYEQLQDGKGYRLTGYLTTGTFVVP